MIDGPILQVDRKTSIGRLDVRTFLIPRSDASCRAVSIESSDEFPPGAELRSVTHTAAHTRKINQSLMEETQHQNHMELPGASYRVILRDCPVAFFRPALTDADSLTYAINKLSLIKAEEEPSVIEL